MRTGTIRNQVQLQVLEQKWQQKKSNPVSSQKADKPMTEQDRMLEDLKKQAAEIKQQNDTADIYTKLKSGGTLTAEEISYLKEHDPEALAKYEEAQAEKKQYERQLKNCKTKEEVQRLKCNRMGNFAAKAKSIANNPYIPKDKKVELMNQLNNEVCVIRDAHDKFVRSAAYQEMPTEGELQEERAEEEKQQTQPESGKTEPDNEQTDNTQADKTEPDKIQTDNTQADKVEPDDIQPDSTQAGKTELNDIQSDGTPAGKTEPDNADLSFEQISNAIERYVIRNRKEKPVFQVNG